MCFLPPKVNNLDIPPQHIDTSAAPNTRMRCAFPGPGVPQMQARAAHRGDVGSEVVELRPHRAFWVVDGDALTPRFAGCCQVALVARSRGVDVQILTSAAGAHAGAEAVDDSSIAASAECREDGGVVQWDIAEPR